MVQAIKVGPEVFLDELKAVSSIFNRVQNLQMVLPAYEMKRATKWSVKYFNGTNILGRKLPVLR